MSAGFQPGLQIIAAMIDSIDPPKRSRKLNTLDALKLLVTQNETGLCYRKLVEFSSPHLLLPPTIHYSTYAKRFRTWANNDVLHQVWVNITKMYGSARLSECQSAFKHLFIDSTMIKNKLGSDCVGANPTDRGRLGTKLSVIVDDAKMPIALVLTGANIPDVSILEETVSSIPTPITQDARRTCILAGDKGYINRADSDFLASHKMRKVTPSRRNARRQRELSNNDKLVLKERHKVENFFANLKQSRRFEIRRDRSIASFKAALEFEFSTKLLSQLMSSSLDEHQNLTMAFATMP